jgi:serine/threonine-protein kinase
LILLVLFALVGVVLSQAGLLFPKSPAATTSSAKASTTSAAPTSKSPSPTSSSATPTESTPPAINLLPDAYKGRPYNEVRSELNGLGLQVKGDAIADPSAPGTVIDINPSGPVEPGTLITVSYSKGPNMVAVPSLEQGATEASVQQAIQGAGLRWQKGAPVEGNGDQPEGTFVSSEPGSGEKVPAGSVVTYHLASAPADTPSASPSVSTTK